MHAPPPPSSSWSLPIIWFSRHGEKKKKWNGNSSGKIRLWRRDKDHFPFQYYFLWKEGAHQGDRESKRNSEKKGQKMTVLLRAVPFLPIFPILTEVGNPFQKSDHKTRREDPSFYDFHTTKLNFFSRRKKSVRGWPVIVCLEMRNGGEREMSLCIKELPSRKNY